MNTVRGNINDPPSMPEASLYKIHSFLIQRVKIFSNVFPQYSSKNLQLPTITTILRLVNKTFWNAKFFGKFNGLYLR